MHRLGLKTKNAANSKKGRPRKPQRSRRRAV
jgi:hypothetical protein